MGGVAKEKKLALHEAMEDFYAAKPFYNENDCLIKGLDLKGEVKKLKTRLQNLDKVLGKLEPTSQKNTDAEPCELSKGPSHFKKMSGHSDA